MAKKLSMKSPKKGKMGGLAHKMNLKLPKMPSQTVSGLARGGTKAKKMKRGGY